MGTWRSHTSARLLVILLVGLAAVAVLLLVRDVSARAQVPSAVMGNIWRDTNANGVQDVDPLFPEPGMRFEEVLVEVLDAGLLVVGSDLTDANGDYLIEGLAAGTYTVRIQPGTAVVGTPYFPYPSTAAAGVTNLLVATPPSAGVNDFDAPDGNLPVGEVTGVVLDGANIVTLNGAFRPRPRTDLLLVGNQASTGTAPFKTTASPFASPMVDWRGAA